MEYIFDATTKLESITVRVWERSLPDRPMSGHYTYDFSYEQAPNIHVAIELAKTALKNKQ